MGSWVDFLGFVATLAAFLGVILAVRYAAKRFNSTVHATKESLRDRGYTISDQGVSIPIRATRLSNREDYVDATQRGFIKAMGASSFSTSDNVDGGTRNGTGNGNGSGSANLGTSAPSLMRTQSSASIKSATGSEKEKEKGRRRFGLRRKGSDS